MNLEKLEKFLKENGQPKFRLEQIKKAIFKDGVSSFSEISTIPKELKEKLVKEIDILSFKVEKVLISKDKQSAKALLKIPCHPELVSGSKEMPKQVRHDKEYYNIETVLISPKSNDWSCCISVQVGCPLGCLFCATGKMGFKRNLTAEEISDQVLFWRQYLKKNTDLFQNSKLKIKNYDVANIVYMGMGEPFLNWENVKESLENLTDKNLFGFGSRSLSVSTAGIPEGISKLAEEFPQINLAISLHFGDQEKRKSYMPIAKKYDLNELKKAVENYFSRCNRKIFIEYVMLDGVNDNQKDLEKLVEYLKSFQKNYLLHVNLISYNMEHGTWSKNTFNPSSKNKIENFKNLLLQNKINCTIRKSLGTEVAAACGQLAGR